MIMKCRGITKTSVDRPNTEVRRLATDIIETFDPYNFIVTFAFHIKSSFIPLENAKSPTLKFVYRKRYKGPIHEDV